MKWLLLCSMYISTYKYLKNDYSYFLYLMFKCIIVLSSVLVHIYYRRVQCVHLEKVVQSGVVSIRSRELRAQNFRVLNWTRFFFFNSNYLKVLLRSRQHNSRALIYQPNECRESILRIQIGFSYTYRCVFLKHFFILIRFSDFSKI